MTDQPIAIYQVLPRLYGNTKENCVPDGSIEQNGCGKFNDFTLARLRAIKKSGYTHIWYTGVIEHATQTDYSAYGIKSDHPQVVKGKAGSPYAIKDYYDVDPDLASSVPDRMGEFEALVARTHQAGLRVIIDFVPNHVAREYFSDSKPAGVRDLGADDDTHKAFDPNNNFYYIPDRPLTTDLLPTVYDHSGATYQEFPAKASGNDIFSERPSAYDWYETAKLNYGVDHVGDGATHFSPIPDTWDKMLDILLYWAGKGIDGFRCDMAEMVPVDFWHYAIAKVKETYPKLFFIAEIYNPGNYRNYIGHGGFDYLYDKVGLYDTLRAIICGYAPASAITQCWQNLDDIRTQMLHFLENHDEQRIASLQFADNADKAIPAFCVCAFFDAAPVMVYAGQEFGEKGNDAEGFSGSDGRTTLFDYWTVPTLRRNLLGKLSEKELRLQAFYQKTLCLKGMSEALRIGKMFDLMYNGSNGFDPNRHYAFLRGTEDECILIVANFSEEPADVEVLVPSHAFEVFGMTGTWSEGTDLMTDTPIAATIGPDQRVKLLIEGYNCRVVQFRKSKPSKKSRTKIAK